MHTLWHWILYLLASWSADPAMIEAERARCTGAVNVAYAALAPEPAPTRRDFPEPENNGKVEKREPFSPEPAPAPRREEAAPPTPLPPIPPAAPCVQCSGTGRIYRSDGGWVKCRCQCPGGRCPTKR